ncbi:hypothetical protein LZ30DRAFT_203560 [Colletotrichum cereale]|nr:hypothetical protein LZ30DRAFT_203560 [Colletotrichum cereale]
MKRLLDGCKPEPEINEGSIPRITLRPPFSPRALPAAPFMGTVFLPRESEAPLVMLRRAAVAI